MKEKIFFCLAAFFLPLSGIFICLAALGKFYDARFLGLEFFWWAVFCLFALLIAIGFLFVSFPKEAKPAFFPKAPEPIEYEKFMKECKLAIRGHLKLSILFWILAYRKEKVKSFEDSKKDVFLEIRKEIPHVRWMDAILDEIQEELGKVK